LKLIDFGLAAWVDSSSQYLTAVVGSAHYLAPEMIRQKYSKPVDVWSAGVMTYLMLFGRYPFDGQNDEQIIRRIKRGSIDWSGEHVSSAAFDLLHQLLQANASNRPSAGEVMKHRFFISSEEATEADETADADEEKKEEGIPEPIVQGLRETVEKTRLSRRTSLEQERNLKLFSKLEARRLSRSASTLRLSRCHDQLRDSVAALVSPKRIPYR